MLENVYKSGSSVEITLKGSEVEVENRVQREFREYSPYGYGTYIKSNKIENGIRTVVIFRYNNCD